MNMASPFYCHFISRLRTHKPGLLYFCNTSRLYETFRRTDKSSTEPHSHFTLSQSRAFGSVPLSFLPRKNWDGCWRLISIPRVRRSMSKGCLGRAVQGHSTTDWPWIIQGKAILKTIQAASPIENTHRSESLKHGDAILKLNCFQQAVSTWRDVL
jgi:hypothetical protein